MGILVKGERATPMATRMMARATMRGLVPVGSIFIFDILAKSQKTTFCSAGEGAPSPAI
jgi:hypothetical protein